jgi:diguanylate cyclase (GGDEF)-like protein
LGDETLRRFGRIIDHAINEGDRAARMGGDEFIIVLSGVSDADATAKVLKRITAATSDLRPLGLQDETRIGISIGVSRFVGEAEFSVALREADIAVYRNKSERRSLNLS